MRSARVWLWIAAASLAAAPAGAENAKHRDGGASSSSSGDHHAAGGSTHSSSTSSSSSGSSTSSDSNATSGSTRPRTQAEADHPAPGTGTGDRHNRRGGYHGGYGGYYGGHRGGYWDGGIWIAGGCYDCYDPWYSPRYRYYRSYDDGVGVRVQVKPEETRVYVDGYYAGVADDFDGLLQRLYVARGQHEIALKLEGFRSHRFVIYGVPGRTIKLHYNMVQGSGDDEAEDLAGAHVPVPPAPPVVDRDDDDEVRDVRPPMAAHPFGRLSLDVRPDDASVYIDGKLVSEAARDEVRLAAGPHRIEVVRPGYQSFERDLEIKPGKTADLDVHLDKK